MRILHCPTVVGGNPCGLARAERLLGYSSESLAFISSAFDHHPDSKLWKDGSSRYQKEKARWRLLFKAWLHFDVIHYNYGSMILQWQYYPDEKQLHPRYWLFNIVKSFYARFCYVVESQLLKRKVIAVTYQGDDARQKDYSLKMFEYSIAQQVDSNYYPDGSDNKKRALIAKIDKFADLIYSLNPDLLHLLPSRAVFTPYAHIDLEQWQYTEGSLSTIPVVLHAPSHAGAKGTCFIVEAVNELKREGLLFEFVLIENMSNSKAKKHYERCDLVIDQLLAGWYGGFAVEAMALGKPVICYLREADMAYIPLAMKQELPIIQATPASIKEVLRMWLTKRFHELKPLSRQSREFVERWHDPIKIARRGLDDYQRIYEKKKRR